MAVFNFGSINLDHIYQVPHFVRPGETLASTHYDVVLGGKGANQSVALARAGADVCHVGVIGQADSAILKALSESGVNVREIEQVGVATGHAIIQVNQQGENAIILFAGANHSFTQRGIDRVLEKVTQDDWVLLQNETNEIPYIIEQANKLGIKVAFNPAPMDANLVREVLPSVDLLIVNEVEMVDLTNAESVDDAIQILQKSHPDLAVILTLGSEGVRYLHGAENKFIAAFRVDVVDTTAAGDTFIGYCLAALAKQLPIGEAMTRACAASALCVGRSGAVPAIPEQLDVEHFLESNPRAV